MTSGFRLTKLATVEQKMTTPLTVFLMFFAVQVHFRLLGSRLPTNMCNLCMFWLNGINYLK